jgi:hypothetical protein
MTRANGHGRNGHGRGLTPDMSGQAGCQRPDLSLAAQYRRGLADMSPGVGPDTGDLESAYINSGRKGHDRGQTPVMAAGAVSSAALSLEAVS